MQFRSITDLYRDVWENLHRIPNDIDVVVGIPRSGMLVATMIALARNLPLAELDGFIAGRILSSGKTRQDPADSSMIERYRHALIVDDSSRTGAAMQEALAALGEMPEPPRLTTCVAYGIPNGGGEIDLVLATVPEPRVFEWNVLHHPIIARACLDIDGVLCIDPAEHENDDGAAYLRFLTEALPLHQPRREIAKLVTSRLEKYRPQTESWLRKHNIRYGELVMLDLPDAETRRRTGAHGSFKAEVYAKADSPLFIESERLQAIEIARLSGKPVLSLEGPEMIQPGALNIKAIGRRARPDRLARKAAKRLLAALGLPTRNPWRGAGASR